MSYFLQSRGWEEFQKSLGRKTWRINGALFILHKLPFGLSYLYAPRPIFAKPLFADDAVKQLTKISREQKAVFSRIEPEREIINFPVGISGCQGRNLQPGKTLITDIGKSENEILADMHYKTRYNIRLAQRHGVFINIFCGHNGGKGAFTDFMNLLRETARREKFFIHPENHYYKLLATDFRDFKNFLVMAAYRGRAVAAAIVNLHENRVTYLHGASSETDRNIMAPQLMHWAIICEMKKYGAEEYDWWGIDEKLWPGVTRFKLSFGGKKVAYPAAIDIVHKPVLYGCYRAARGVAHGAHRLLEFRESQKI